MKTFAGVIEEGIRAYTRGDLQEARRCWTEVLAAEPMNARAQSYLALLDARAAIPPVLAERPLPAPAGGAPGGAGAPGPEADDSPWDHGPAAAPAVVLGDGVGLDLSTVLGGPPVHPLVPDAGPAPPVTAPAAGTDVEVWMQGARELFALGDFSGSLEMIEKILRADPAHAEARAYLQQNEATLIAMYESKLGPLENRPTLAIRHEEIMWLNLDHRAGFLLAQVDGTVSYDDLFALAGLPRLDTARILAMLLQEGVIRS